MSEALRDLDPASTLFIVASKTFTTLETMTNAHAARAWLVAALGDDAVSQHFVAVSTNAEKVAEFGIDTGQHVRLLGLGRRAVLDGLVHRAQHHDRHRPGGLPPAARRVPRDGRRTSPRHPRTQNLPLLMGLLSVWNRDFLGIETTAVLPYSQYLSRFPAYLQQLTMESNGKSVRLDGSPVGYQTGAIYWGEPGTNGQHSFYQLLHQGTSTVACDVIVVARAESPIGDMQDMLVANALAQAAVLARGRTADEVAADGTPADLVPHKVMPGNRPDLGPDGPAARPVRPGRARRALRAQRVRAGRRLGHRLLRPVGRRARQEGGDGHPRRARPARPRHRSTPRRMPRSPSTRRCASGRPPRGGAGSARTRGRSPRRWPRAGRQRRAPPRAA